MVPCLDRAEQRDQVSAGGGSHGADVVRINTVAGGIGPYPAHGVLHVIQLRGKVVIGGVYQAIVHHEAYISALGKAFCQGTEVAFVPTAPAAAVNEDDRRPETRGRQTYNIQ